MKSSKTPLLILAGLLVCFLGALGFSTQLLPERVATHFNLQGQPDAWMSRAGHLWAMGIFGVAFPAVLAGTVCLCSYVPKKLINIPQRDYWLSEANRPRFLACMTRHSLWLACMAEGFIIVMASLVLSANARNPVQLSTPLLMTGAALFLAAVTVWLASLLHRLQRTN